MKIRKRDGTLQQFTVKKIKRALVMAFTECDVPVPNLNPLVNAVSGILSQATAPVDIEIIQDAVEKVLMDNGHNKVAKHFIIYREGRRIQRDKRLTPDNTALAEYIHAAKYARYDTVVRRRETYSETVERVLSMHLRRWPEHNELISGAFDYVYKRRVLPSMRSMQFGGEAIDVCNARMYNCAFTLIDRPSAFSDSFYLLLCGCGVGYSVQWCHINKLPTVATQNTKDVIHVSVEDSVEGWADAFHALIYAGFSGYYTEFDYSRIRKEGSSLKTSGGKAPGHLPLKRCIEQVRGLLNVAQGRKLRPIECHDIMCFLGEAVLSGGIRRSALISLFSADDTEMLYAKARGNFRPRYGQDPGLNSHRQMANNSAVLVRSKVTRDVFDRIITVAKENFGDPGFFFTEHEDYGTNPCGEIGLEPTLECTATEGKSDETGFSFCNLCEINGALCKTPEDFYDSCRAASIIGTLQSAYTDFSYLGWTTEAIAIRDRLLGVGIMGLANNPDLFFNRADVLQRGAKIVLDINEEVAKLLLIKPAARCTTVKPGGTAPLEASYEVLVSSGIHPHHSRRYFRRVTANPNEPVAKEYKRVNPHQVEEKPDGDWSIIFPQQCNEDAITIKEQSARDFLQTVYHVFENWVAPGTRRGVLTHNVSATCTIRENEDVLEDVWNNRHRLAALSFAPYALDQIFPFAPRQIVDGAKGEALWNDLITNYVPVDWNNFSEESDETTHSQDPACVSGICDV
ncbi:MAG: ATP cone domain-containing protein [Nitrosopumilus sp.]